MSSIVLVVDDDMPRARRTADWFIDAGYRVVHTRDVWSAAIAVGVARAVVVIVAHQAHERADAEARARFCAAVSAARIAVVTYGPEGRQAASTGAAAHCVHVAHNRAELIAAVNRCLGPRGEAPQNPAKPVPLSGNA